MTIVLDATVVIKLITREPGADAALARIVTDDDRIAPDWIGVEVANALTRKVFRQGLPADTAVAALAASDDYLTEVVVSLSLIEAAFDLSIRLTHAVYDCLYLALAIERDAAVVTNDKEFARSARRAGLSRHVELLA